MTESARTRQAVQLRSAALTAEAEEIRRLRDDQIAPPPGEFAATPLTIGRWWSSASSVTSGTIWRASTRCSQNQCGEPIRIVKQSCVAASGAVR